MQGEEKQFLCIVCAQVCGGGIDNGPWMPCESNKALGRIMNIYACDGISHFERFKECWDVGKLRFEGHFLPLPAAAADDHPPIHHQKRKAYGYGFFSKLPRTRIFIFPCYSQIGAVHSD